jgi:predicted GIY-YIG superfamily endonuclease
MTGWIVWLATIMSYYVYIIASRKDGAIYVGVTNDIVRRIYEHRIKAVPGFASKYNITQLVWFENLPRSDLRHFPRERAEEVEAELEGRVD